MLVDLTPLWITLANCLAFPLLMMSVAYGVTHKKMSADCYRLSLYRIRNWENEFLYERLFGVRIWKDWLPDGASLFTSGFRKKKLARRDATYLKEFTIETCRGELAHWMDIAFLPVFWIWNPLEAAIFVTVFGILINAPCILTQRYNRLRFLKILPKKT